MQCRRFFASTISLACLIGLRSGAAALTTSDRAAAIIVFPLVTAFEIRGADGSFLVEDTVIQLSNSLTEPVSARCFYENANSHCTNSGAVCGSAEQCCDPSTGCGICLPGWNETDFRIQLTPRQPLGWRALEGLSEFPLDGVSRSGVDGSSNAGSRIPPVPENPFVGSLKCVAVDGVTGVPVDSNALLGTARIELAISLSDDGASGAVTAESGAGQAQLPSQQFVDISEYNGVGLEAIPGAVNDDQELVLGGDGAEYEGCPNVLIVDHLFDFALNPVNGDPAVPYLALAPCSEDILHQRPGSAVVQYLVFNEFEQRFSTSKSVECLQFQPLATIDTTQPERSIFSASVSGTLTGQTRLTPIGSGLIGVAGEGYGLVTVTDLSTNTVIFARPLITSAQNVHFQGDRENSDRIILP
jgi:hypothetical protein